MTHGRVDWPWPETPLFGKARVKSEGGGTTAVVFFDRYQSSPGRPRHIFPAEVRIGGSVLNHIQSIAFQRVPDQEGKP